MPVKYIPYTPDTIEGQAILDNITRTRRVLRYRDSGKVHDHLRRGLPLYETAEAEVVGAPDTPNLLLRGECQSACAYLKDKGVTLDLVYIDPPFASGADYAKSVYLRRHPHKAQEIAQAEEELEIDELRAFEEKMYGDIWNKEDYLNWMFENLTAIKAVMSDTASIYVHLDWHIGHYVKVLMDEVFGEASFVNEIIWRRAFGHSDSDRYGNIHDTVLFYGKAESRTWNKLLGPPNKEYIEQFFDGYDEQRGERYQRISLSAGGLSGGGYDYEYKGVRALWRCPQETLEKHDAAGRLHWPKKGVPRLIRYESEYKGTPLQDIWADVSKIHNQSSELADYATQKPEALLKRIIEASSNVDMIVGDFFGGSGVTAKVAHDLGRRFVHVDVGVNSLQTARDRLKAAGAAFRVLDIQDGVSLFRNPVQTMDKLKTLIVGLKNEDGLDKFWEGGIQDSKLGTVPVYLPNLLDHQTKVLDVPLINRVLHEALPDLPDGVKQAIVYYVDIFDRPAVEKFIKDENMTGVQVELRDLKEILDEIVLNDVVEYRVRPTDGVYEVEVTSFASDRLQQKIDEYNQKKGLTGKAKASLLGPEAGPDDGDADGTPAPPRKAPFKPIHISEDGLELIEWVSLDCTGAEGAWHADAEIKVDRKGFVTRDGRKTRAFWDAKITAPRRPLRLRVRNIAGDESTLLLE